MSYAPGDTVRIPVTGDTLTGLDGTTSPYGLYRNGSRDASVTVTVTGAGGDWLVTLTIPSGYSLGDALWLKLLATTADGTYVIASEPIVLADVQSAAAAAIRDYDPPTNAEFEARTLPGGVYLQYDVFLGFIQLMCRADSMADTDRLIWLQAINADEGAGAGTFDNTKESQQALRNDLLDAVDSLDTAGNGPYPCTWTIEYDTQPLQNAVVAFYLGTVLKGRGLTDADGRVAMSLAAGQYTVAIEAAGFAHVPEWYTVSAAETTWENTFNNLEPVGTVPESSESGQCTGYGYTYDADGVLSPVTGICCRLVAAPEGSGVIVSDTVRTETSDVSALVSFAGLWIGAQYRFWVSGSDKQHTITISEADVDEDGLFPLPNFYG